MKHEMANIVACEKLKNDYSHLTLATSFSPGALPGQFVCIEKTYLCYVMGQQRGLEILLPPHLSLDLSSMDKIEVSSLQGTPLPVPEKDFFYLLLVYDLGLSAGIFYFKKYRALFKGLALIGTNSDFPFAPCPSRKIIPGIAADIIGALPLLEDWGISHRLASLQEQPGIFHGSIETLAQQWLQHAHPFVPYQLSITSLDQASTPPTKFLI